MSKLLAGYNVYHKLTVTTYKNLLDLASYILGIKMANFCPQVLKPLGSYKRDFTVSEMRTTVSLKCHNLLH